MKYTLVASLLSLAALVVAYGPLTVNTPADLFTCQVIEITWSGGVAPYTFSVLPGGQVTAAPFESFPNLESTGFEWNTNIVFGTEVTLEVTDSTGNVEFSSPVEVQEGAIFRRSRVLNRQFDPIVIC